MLLAKTTALAIVLVLVIVIFVLAIACLFGALILMGAVAVYNLIADRHSTSYRIQTLTFGKAILITVLRAPFDFLGGVGSALLCYAIGARAGIDLLSLKIWSYLLTYVVTIINLTALLILFARAKFFRALFASFLYSLWFPVLVFLLLASLSLIGWIIRWTS